MRPLIRGAGRKIAAPSGDNHRQLPPHVEQRGQERALAAQASGRLGREITPVSMPQRRDQPMLVRGRVLDTEGKPIDGALLDVWQTNEDGFYDVQRQGVQPEFNLRGVFTSGPGGEYWFRSAKPRFYPIPGL